MLEIMLRNAINTHYKQYFNDENWIINQARPSGLLEQEASNILRIQHTYTNMGGIQQRQAGNFLYFWLLDLFIYKTQLSSRRKTK